MAVSRSLLGRVRRIEVARLPARSGFESAPGGLDAWEAECRTGIDAGFLDPIDVPEVMLAVRRWHRDGAWAR